MRREIWCPSAGDGLVDWCIGGWKAVRAREEVRRAGVCTREQLSGSAVSEVTLSAAVKRQIKWQPKAKIQLTRTCSLCLEVEATVSECVFSLGALGLAAGAVVVCDPFLARSFSSSSSSSSSRLLIASSLASIQSITFPIVIPFPTSLFIDPEFDDEGSAAPPTDTPCWIMSSRSWHAAPYPAL